MKRANLLNFLAGALLLATAVTTTTGCKKTPKNITNIPGMRNGGIGNEDPGKMITTGPGSGTGLIGGSPSGTNLNPGDVANPIAGAEDRAKFAAQTIYFDFDRSAIKASEQGKLDQLATAFKSAPAGSQLKSEGNCDERGTPEYNRALGERRAIAARDYLIQKHGIESSRITTLSNGEDKPVDLGKTEEAYAKNRRDDFVLITPQ